MEEKIYLGILGEYPIEDVECDADFDSDEEYYGFIRDTFAKYSENMERLDDTLLYNMYKALYDCEYTLWEKEEFKKIIDEDKLPDGFWNMSEEEKTKVLYGFEFDENDAKEKITNHLPFINLLKLKDDLEIHNVTIEQDYGEIYIEFFGICNFFTAMVTVDYENGFEVKAFQAT